MEPIIAPSSSSPSIKDRLGTSVPPMAQRFKGSSSSSFVVGFDVTDQKVEEARQKRLNRFGKEIRPAVATPMDTSSPTDPDTTVSVGQDSFPEDLPEGSGYERSEALFVFGVDNMNTNEVMKVFQSYNPNHLEWVNDQSCVIIWKNALDAKRALFALGKWELDRPVAATQAANSADGDTAMATEMKEEDGQSRQLISAPAPEPVVWRSTASGHNSRQLLLRIAKDGDRKHRGAARKSEFYRKYGNPHTGQAGAVSIDDLRTRAKKRRRSDSDSSEVVESSATVTQGADDEMQVDTKDARLTIEVPNTKDSAEDSDSDDNTETAEDTEDTAEEDNERHHLSMASRSELQMLTIKVEQDSDEEEERQQRLKQVRDEEAAEERRLRHRPPSPKRAKAVSAADAARLDNLQKMCITISVDRESEDRERRRKQREQDRLMEEQRQAILARRHQRLQEGRKPTLSSVVIMPNTTREPSRKPPASDFGEMSSAGIKTEGEHSSAVLAGSGDLRNRLKDRKRGADSGSGFKSHAPGSLTITCDFDDR